MQEAIADVSDLSWAPRRRRRHESGESGVASTSEAPEDASADDLLNLSEVSAHRPQESGKAARVAHLSGDSGVGQDCDLWRCSEHRRRTKSDDTASSSSSFRDEVKGFLSARARQLRRFADKETTVASVRNRSQSIAEEGEYSFERESVQTEGAVSTSAEASAAGDRPRRNSDQGRVPAVADEAPLSPRKRSTVKQFFDSFRPRARSENQQSMQRPTFRKRRDSGDAEEPPADASAASGMDQPSPKQLDSIPQGRPLQASGTSKRRGRSPVGDLVTRVRNIGTESQERQRKQPAVQQLPHPKDLPLDISFCASVPAARALRKTLSTDDSSLPTVSQEPGSVKDRHSDLFSSLHHADTEGQCSILSRAAVAESGPRARRMSGPALMVPAATSRQRAASGSDVQVTENEKYIIFKSRCQTEPSPDLQQLQELCSSEPDGVFRHFARLHTCYEVLPNSSKLLVFDTSLNVKKAFFALVYNGLRAAPLWDGTQQKFVGMLTVTDFIHMLHGQYSSALGPMEELETHRISVWRAQLKSRLRPLQWISPEASLLNAVRLLLHSRVHRLLLIDACSGNALCIVTHKRLLKFISLHMHLLPMPPWLDRSVRQLGVGTFNGVVTVSGTTPLLRVLALFVKHRVSALPVLDADGRLQDIYSKFDVLNLAATKTYHNLEVSVTEALQYRKSRFEGVVTCNADDSLKVVVNKLVEAEVHRLVVVDDDRRVTGIVSLSDVLQAVVLQSGQSDSR